MFAQTPEGFSIALLDARLALQRLGTLRQAETAQRYVG